MLSITVHNESFSYSFYVLAYDVEHKQYKLSVVTRIVPLNNTNLFMTMVNIDVSLCQKAIEPVFCPQFCALVSYYT